MFLPVSIVQLSPLFFQISKTRTYKQILHTYTNSYQLLSHVSSVYIFKEYLFKQFYR